MDRFQGKSTRKTCYNNINIYIYILSIYYLIYIYIYNGYVSILKSRFLQNHPGFCFAGLNAVGCTKFWPFYDNHASL